MTSLYGGSLIITRAVPLNNHVKSSMFDGLGTKYLIKIVQMPEGIYIYTTTKFWISTASRTGWCAERNGQSWDDWVF